MITVGMNIVCVHRHVWDQVSLLHSAKGNEITIVFIEKKFNFFDF